MAIVDGRGTKRSGGGIAEGNDILRRLTQGPAPVSHDYPACATFRGGKCTCDETDKLCPHCGSEEWDRITDRTSPGASFNRCNRCEREWAPKDGVTLVDGECFSRQVLMDDESSANDLSATSGGAR